MKYFLYKTLCTVNNKIYVGIHQSEDINIDTYIGSGKALISAMKKYGKDKFFRVILAEFRTRTEALDAERAIVNDEFIASVDTYNIVRGGGAVFNPEQIKAHAISCKEAWRDPVKRKQRSERAKEQWKSEEMRKRVAEKLRGRKQSPQHIQNRFRSILLSSKNATRASFHRLGGTSSKGTCYVFNSEEVKRIDNSELDKYLSCGWRKGTGRKNKITSSRL